MKANSFLLFFLYLLFTVSCTENEVEPSFSIGTTEDIEIAPEAGGQTKSALRVLANGRQVLLPIGLRFLRCPVMPVQ